MQADEKEIEILATAYLAGEGRRNKEIAPILGISEVAVARNLARARTKYLRYQISFLHHSVPRSLMEKVRQRITRKALEDRLNDMAERHGQSRKFSLRVFPSGPLRDDRERMMKLGSAAAPLIKTFLLRSKSVGLTWGGMLKDSVTGLRNLSVPPPWRKEIVEFIPLSASPALVLPVSSSVKGLSVTMSANMVVELVGSQVVALLLCS